MNGAAREEIAMSLGAAIELSGDAPGPRALTFAVCEKLRKHILSAPLALRVS
jgi:hypothetical protein